MGHKENGGIGITGLKMGLAVSPCHIIFSLDIFCKSFVPLPSLCPFVEFVITPWKKCCEYCCQEKDCQFSWNGSRIFCLRTWGTFLFAFGLKTLESIEISYSHVRIFSQTDVDENWCFYTVQQVPKMHHFIHISICSKVSNINFWVFMDPSHMKNSNGSHFYIVPTFHDSLEMCLFSVEFAILRASYQIRFLQVQVFK